MSDKRRALRYFLLCSKIHRIEKEGYLCKQVLFNGKTHVITTLETL